MVKNSAMQDPASVLAAALGLLVRQGYGSTGVEELADASGISRSTFFRKFRSKEDMVFADHERILSRVDEALSQTAADPLGAVADAAKMVFNEHVRNRETSILRSRLLREVPTLRDRELATMHRYERLFRQHLQSALPEAARKSYAAVAFPAAVVAVHNKVLRQWLQAVTVGTEGRLDQEMTAELGNDLGNLVNLFRPALFPSTDPEPGRPAVVVTVLDPAAGTDKILEAVRQALL